MYIPVVIAQTGFSVFSINHENSKLEWQFEYHNQSNSYLTFQNIYSVLWTKFGSVIIPALDLISRSFTKPSKTFRSCQFYWKSARFGLILPNMALKNEVCRKLKKQKKKNPTKMLAESQKKFWAHFLERGYAIFFDFCGVESTKLG